MITTTSPPTVIAHDPGTYLVPSRSREGHHLVDTTTSPWQCSCEAFEFNVLPVIEGRKPATDHPTMQCSHIDHIIELRRLNRLPVPRPANSLVATNT